MEPFLLVPENFNSPELLINADDYLIVYKPPRMHSAPGGGENLVDWAAEKFPEILKVKSRKEGEGGLLHRLDYETHGLLLFAKNQMSFDAFFEAQSENKIVKEYGALAVKRGQKLPGFPARLVNFPPEDNPQKETFVIESFFRPWGKGRKQVRPLPPEFAAAAAGEKSKYKNLCQTVFLESRIKGTLDGNDLYYFRVSLRRGFRHQIRCHLAWQTYPVLNDPLYGGAETPGGFLALRAEALRFADPASGEERCYRLPEINNPALKGRGMLFW